MSRILVDTNVWIGHFRNSNPLLQALLEDDEILCHPVIVGELSMGSYKNRALTLDDLGKLLQPPIASFAETRALVENRRLWGRGVQWNDVQILASALIGRHPLWTYDRRLNELAEQFGVGFKG